MDRAFTTIDHDRPKTKGGFLCGVLFFLIVVGYHLRWGADVRGWLHQQQRLPISHIQLEGERHYVDIEEIRQVVRQATDSHHFFALDVSTLQQELQAVPWVTEALVRKRWPDDLRIQITEQKVAARWGSNRFLNEAGEIFVAPDRVTQPLLQLSGPDEQASRVQHQAEQFDALLKLNGYTLEKVNLTPRHAWELTLKDGIRLYLGRGDALAQLQRFIRIFPMIQPNNMVASVDLRYDTGVAVGWKRVEESKNDQNRR